MASFLRRSIPAILVFLLNTGLQISGYQNLTLAVILWSLMVPAAVFAVWPWIKRIRVGFKPPDAELRKALEARDRWREHFEAKQSEVRKLNDIREQQLEKIREVEQERDQIQSEYDSVRGSKHWGDLPAREIGVSVDTAALKAENEQLKRQNEELTQRLNEGQGE